MINLITLLIGMILVSVIVACLIVFKIYGSIQDVLKSIADLYDEIGTQTDLQSSIDMRLRIRHIEMLKTIYVECIKTEDYEGAEKLREVIKKENNELNEIYGS